MDLRQDHGSNFTPAYEARLAEEETKLRWPIARHPGNRELAYYLIFLLAANGRYAQALMECHLVLECYPGDIVGEMWRELIHIRWLVSLSDRHQDALDGEITAAGLSIDLIASGCARY